MSTEVVTAIISFCGIIVSAVVSMSLVNWRLQQLERKVDEHNSWGAKFAKQETDIALIKNDVGYIKSAIEKLERSKEHD